MAADIFVIIICHYSNMQTYKMQPRKAEFADFHSIAAKASFIIHKFYFTFVYGSIVCIQIQVFFVLIIFGYLLYFIY